MRILLFGANGQVGSECRSAFSNYSWNVTSLTRIDVDFVDPEAVYSAVKNACPDIVVNACAYTAVDKAESEAELAYCVNAESVGMLAKACAELKIPVIHISTDYVFDGKSTTPYEEENPVAPMGVYGESKLAGEKLLQTENPDHILLRTSWVFGIHGNNFVKTMLRLAQSRSVLGVVADQRGCPTFARDIAETIAVFIDRYEKDGTLPWGVYHCSNSGECSWYEFALAIFESATKYKLLIKSPTVNAITTEQYPTPVARPAYSVLSTEKVEDFLGEKMPHWRHGLNTVLASAAQSG